MASLRYGAILRIGYIQRAEKTPTLPHHFGPFAVRAAPANERPLCPHR